jgi:hypothetical protein
MGKVERFLRAKFDYFGKQTPAEVEREKSKAV